MPRKHAALLVFDLVVLFLLLLDLYVAYSLLETSQLSQYHQPENESHFSEPGSFCLTKYTTLFEVFTFKDGATVKGLQARITSNSLF